MNSRNGITMSMIADCSVRRIPRRQPLHESISYPNVSPTHEAATEPIRHPDLQRQWNSIGAAPYRHSPEPISMRNATKITPSGIHSLTSAPVFYRYGNLFLHHSTLSPAPLRKFAPGVKVLAAFPPCVLQVPATIAPYLPPSYSIATLPPPHHHFSMRHVEYNMSLSRALPEPALRYRLSF